MMLRHKIIRVRSILREGTVNKEKLFYEKH